MSMSYLFGLLHSFVIQRQSGSDHSCFVIFTPLTSDNGFVGQALPLAIRWIGRRRACPTVLLTDNAALHAGCPVVSSLVVRRATASTSHFSRFRSTCISAADSTIQAGPCNQAFA